MNTGLVIRIHVQMQAFNKPWYTIRFIEIEISTTVWKTIIMILWIDIVKGFANGSDSSLVTKYNSAKVKVT